MKSVFRLLFAWGLLSLGGCVQMVTKGEAYPLMYTEQQPVSMLIVPAINETTAADAGELLSATVSQPFANYGYYVLPVPIVNDIFRREGILAGDQIKGVPTAMFKQTFGADSVLFVTIEAWDKNYAILAANVTVAIEYVLLSTETNEVLWSYEQSMVLDTSGSSGNILADLITTALTTATTDYVPIAAMVHQTATKAALPFGQYHPKHGQDGGQRSVLVDSQTGALEQD